jgi:hypothetical protein
VYKIRTEGVSSKRGVTQQKVFICISAGGGAGSNKNISKNKCRAIFIGQRRWSRTSHSAIDTTSHNVYFATNVFLK